MGFDLVDVAENGWGLTSALPVKRREVADDLILIDEQGTASFRLALRNRFAADQVEHRIDDVRGWFGHAGRDDFTWVVGISLDACRSH